MSSSSIILVYDVPTFLPKMSKITISTLLGSFIDIYKLAPWSSLTAA